MVKNNNANRRHIYERYMINKAILGSMSAFNIIIDMNIDFICMMLRRYGVKSEFKIQVLKDITERIYILLREFNNSSYKLTVWIIDIVKEFLKRSTKYRSAYRWTDISTLDDKDKHNLACAENRLTTDEFDIVLLHKNFELEYDEISSMLDIDEHDVINIFKKGYMKLKKYYKRNYIDYEKISRTRERYELFAQTL